MKQTPKLAHVQARMQPGEITLEGFLGEDSRPLADILAADSETIHAGGLSHASIADRLTALTEVGRDLAEREIEVEGRYYVLVREDRGLLPSPWGDGLFPKGEVRLRDGATGYVLRWNELTVHMIRAHGFYGGVGSDFRIDPARAIEILGLTPEPSRKSQS